MPEPAISARLHWTEYLIEAAALGLFMISACSFGILLHHPDSPAVAALPDPFLRRALTGIAMGLTAISLILSPFGQRSGAHMNPAVTWNFFLLGKVKPYDAAGYILAHFIGASAGVFLSALLFRSALSHAAVHYVVTQPGPAGDVPAFFAELAISALLMFTVLTVSNHARLHRYTPYFAGSLVALYITFEAPISGMSMNPARSFGSAFNAASFQAIWIYFTAPVLGMMLAGYLFKTLRGVRRVHCAKLHHANSQPCIFNCRFGDLL